MPSVAEVLLNVLGESTNAQAALAAIQRDLSRFDRTEASAEIALAGRADVEAELQRLRRRLEALDDEDIGVEVRVDVDRAIAELNMAERRLGEFWRNAVRLREQGILDPGEFSRQVTQMIADTQRLAAQVEGAMGRVNAARRAMPARESVTVDVDVSGIGLAEAQLDAMERQLRELDQLSADPEIRLRAQAFMSGIALARRRLQDLRDESKDGVVDARGVSAATQAVLGLGRGVASLASDYGRLAAAVAQQSSALGRGIAAFSNFKRAIGGFASSTRDFQEAAMVAAGAIVTSLVPALIALIGAMAGAAAGAGALGVALGAVAGPALGLVAGLVSRFTKVLEAKKAVEAENENVTNLSAQAERQAAAAEEARVQALHAIRDAQQGVVTAERALAQARESARDEIANAARAEVDAQRARTEALREVDNAQRALADARRSAHQQIMDAIQAERDAEQRLADVRRAAAESIRESSMRVADAQQRVRDAATDAYDAMAESIRAARDAQLELLDAQISHEEALLRVEEAELAVTEAARDQQGALAGVRREFEQFDRLSVDLGPVFTGGVQSEATRAAGGGGESPEQRALRLRRALIELRRAQLGVEQSSARQADATEDAARAQADAARFARDGIAAYEPYADAVRNLSETQREHIDVQRDAQRAIADARREEREAHAEATRLRNTEVAQFPQVRTAMEGLREANLRAADATRDLADATAERQELEDQGVRGHPAVISAMEGLRDARERLTEAQRQGQRAGKDEFASIPGQVNAAKVALDKLTDAERAYLEELDTLGDRVNKAITPGTDQIFMALTDVFRSLPDALFDLVGDVFLRLGRGWGQSIRRVGAELIGPAWMSALRVFGDAAVSITSPVTETIIALGNGLRDIAVAVMPLFTDMVKRGASGIQDLVAGMGGVEGARQIFTPLIGLFRTFVRIVVQVARAVVNFVRAGAPGFQRIGDLILAATTSIADFLGSAEGMDMVAGFIRDIIDPSAQLIGFLGQVGLLVLQLVRFGAQLGGVLIPILGSIVQLFNAVLAVVLPITGVFFGLVRVVTDLVALTIATAVDGWVAILTVLAGILERVAGWFLKLIDQGAWFKRGLEALRATVATFVGRLRELAVTLGTAIANGFRDFAPRLVAAGLALMGRVVGAVRNLFGTFVGLGVDLIHAVGDGLSATVRWLVGIGTGVIEALLAPFRALVGLIGDLMEPITGVVRSILNGVVGVVNTLIGAINWLIGVVNDIPDLDTPFGTIGIPNVATIPTLPMLAAGGIATGRTLAQLGEAGREAVLPLTRGVFADLGAAISRAMVVTPGTGLGARAATAVAPATAARPVEQHFHIPASPAAHGQPDARDTAAKLALAMRKTGARRG